MELTTLHIPQDVAKAKLRAVRTELHRKAGDRYKDLESLYQALGDGVPILNLDATMRAAESFDDGLPCLAIARADRRRVECVRYPEEVVFYAGARPDWRWHRMESFGTMLTSVSRMPKIANGVSGETLVPGIPPEVRQRMRDRKASRLKDHFILWEVESWDPVPDRDPLLLRALGGPYYAILDHWELSEMEANILSGAKE